MLLAVDVGNSQTHLGAFEGESLRGESRLDTDRSAAPEALAESVAASLEDAGLDPAGFDALALSTVVPSLGPAYGQVAADLLGVECLEVDPVALAGPAGVELAVTEPEALGADRFVNAVACIELFGGPCASVDFGTSTNFDVVDAERRYLGGAIGPGVELSLDGLSSGAARLPEVELEAPGPAIGKDTLGAIRSGFGYGFAGLVDGLNDRIAAELGTRPRFVATGGLAPLIAPFCETVDEVDPHLTLTGLRILHGVASA